MLIKKTAALALAMTSVAMSLAHAELPTHSSNIFVYGKYGTQGAGAGVGYVINDQYSVRGGINSGSTQNGTRRIDDIRYKTSRKTDLSLELMADWYPLSNHAIRLTGGLILNDTATRLTAKPDSAGNYTINRNMYSAAETGQLTGKVRPDRIAPYIGVGWESSKPGTSGLRFTGDIGAIHYAGRRSILTTSGAAGNAKLQDDLLAEQTRVKNVNDIGLVMSIGVSYSF
ncbi:MAG: hypothetical protein Q7W55_03550 [Pseudohongiella sp.]|nr:hypothetical protein [Pseudohongiella sp.]